MEIFLCGILISLVVIWIFQRKRNEEKNIPGPKGLPFFGCGFEVTIENIHEKFYDYARAYGDIFKVKLMSNTIISLNSGELIRLAAAGDHYKKYLNDRATTFYGEVFLHGSQTAGFCKDGCSEEHNTYRKGVTKALKVYGADGFSAFEEKILDEINNGLMTRIESFHGEDFDIVHELQISLSNTLACVLRGKPFQKNERNTDMFERFSHLNNFLLNPSVNNILTSFPFIRQLPGPFKKEITKGLETKEIIIDAMFKKQKESFIPGTTRGVIDYLLENQITDIKSGRKPFFTDERIISQLLETVGAGLSTTWSAISNTFLCLLNHPEYQEKMFEELDRVVGGDRDLNHNDRAKCPFFEAVELEVHRYITTVPLLLPKLCRVNLNFEGYDFHKGDIVYGNIWYIHHNEKIWGDPWNFRPERWLDEEGNVVPRDHIYRKNWIPFGHGRRKCIGEQFARSRYFLYVGSLLRRWKFLAAPGRSISCDPRDSSNFDITVTMRPKALYCHVRERR